MAIGKTTIYLIVSLFMLGVTAVAQDSLAIKWNSSVQKISDKKYEVLITGDLPQGWHVYTSEDARDELGGIRISYEDSAINAAPFQLKANSMLMADPIFENRKKNIATGTIELRQNLQVSGEIPPVVELKISYELADKENFLPEEQKLKLTLDAGFVPVAQNRIRVSSIDLKHSVTDCATSGSVNAETKSRGLFGLFLLGFLGGLVALLTPCVFPMIPLTVSFFTKKAVNKKAGISNAFLYGFFIFFIYLLLSLPFHFLDKLNPEILNNISTNVYLNVFFFVIFIVFAFSFFGFYEITLPPALSSKVDSKAGAGNVAGIFFMALTLALVSFSCTGPILGSLLAGSLSNDGGAMQLTAGMGGFGLALALPFALFALFPNWLNSLPKSGGWLNTVKIVLGFAELALALKFLSNADLVKHWGILKREIFIGLWVLISLSLALYLFGKIRFSHEGTSAKLPRGRILLGVVIGLFTLYLLPGVTNTKWANLTLISGFPPPLYYSIYPTKSDCVLDLNCTHDYEEGLRLARSENKPLLLDFTGYACVNCRRMEEKVWSQPEVYKLMKEKFIVISLYVDDKKKLPAAQRFTYTTKDGVSKEITTVGDKWATFETENFNNNAQPLYAILDVNEILLTRPVGYSPSSKEYLEWLRCGLSAFQRKK